MYRRDARWWDDGRTTDGDRAAGLVAGVVSAAVLVVAFGALALGVDAWWLAFPLGYGGVLPLAVGLARRRTEAAATRPDTDGLTQTTDDEALARLRTRYATGEIDETEFEDRVETLLMDETRRDDPARDDR